MYYFKISEDQGFTLTPTTDVVYPNPNPSQIEGKLA